MVARNDITGDKLQSRKSNQNYRDNYENIFKKKKVEEKVEEAVDLSAAAIDDPSIIRDELDTEMLDSLRNLEDEVELAVTDDSDIEK